MPDWSAQEPAVRDELRLAHAMRLALEDIFGPILNDPNAVEFQQGILVNGPACQRLLEAIRRYDEATA